ERRRPDGADERTAHRDRAEGEARDAPSRWGGCVVRDVRGGADEQRWPLLAAVRGRLDRGLRQLHERVVVALPRDWRLVVARVGRDGGHVRWTPQALEREGAAQAPPVERMERPGGQVRHKVDQEEEGTEAAEPRPPHPYVPL